MLDVAAVAERLIVEERGSPSLRQALILLTALHDLGKIGNRFRAMLRDGLSQGGERHWQVTEALLDHHRQVLEEALGGDPDSHSVLYAAVSGHHGRPPDADVERGFRAMLRTAGTDARADSRAVIDAFLSLWPNASLERITFDQATALSWWLPGFVSTADWIGSNTDWFPPVEASVGLAEYLGAARDRADRALREAGIVPPPIAGMPLFDFTDYRPMQLAVKEVDLPEGPMLALIEDETGSGKTEAALLLAQRMMEAGKGRGLFVALPTMATADAMFLRVRDVLERLYSSAPSLTLAHGRARLSGPFRDLVGRRTGERNEPTCTPWLADSRRRALLANVGVGTIDQALLGVLPTRFSTLRLYGLSSKILIVDEVHELGDPYMAEELERLLQAHRMAGGSAILLTATLPLSLRRKLLATYGGLDDDPAYPALTVAGGAAKRDLPQATGARGAVTVERIASPGEAVRLLAERAADGAACVWVRNAVDDAIAGAGALRALGVEVCILHARFALSDRKRIEAEVLRLFGKERKDRPGRVLVATQVVESSLDLDFDVMVSDLAPVAALIQRAGRLWRHMDRRPFTVRPVPSPVLHVLSPDPDRVEDEHWLREVLDRGAWTYPVGVQWRTARVLFDTGRIEAPSGLRALIEAVDRDDPVPSPIEAAELERIGQRFAQANRARHNLVDLAAGFRRGGAGAEDTDYPTRLGQPQRMLMLARWVGRALVPWSEMPELSAAENAQLSELQASERRLAGVELPDQESPEIAALKADWPDWKREAVTVCPVGASGTICEGLRYKADRGLLFA